MKNLYNIMKYVDEHGNIVGPRGLYTKEVLGVQFIVTYPFSSFKARKYNLSYTKKEFLWYLSGDPYNEDILKASLQWNKFRQKDGSWFSNYGQYWFSPHTLKGLSGYHWVVKQLRRDRFSRQAIIPMLSRDHLFEGNPDVVCTAYINFHIRDDRLHMYVRMRSSDIIWGYGNDLPCFWFLWHMIAAELNVPTGNYIHSSDSLHVYSRHFDILKQIVEDGESGFYRIDIPDIPKLSELSDSEFMRWLKYE